MKKFSSGLLAILLGLVAAGSVMSAQDNADVQDIVAACKEEARGAIDVEEYVEACVKEKQEEMKEAAAEKDNG